jgi:hypothetical protein
MCRAMLEHLGCPDVRQGQGSEEWKQTKGTYIKTPDLVAGPLVGNGHESDFYIDVFEPSGDPYVKPLAGKGVTSLPSSVYRTRGPRRCFTRCSAAARRAVMGMAFDVPPFGASSW